MITQTTAPRLWGGRFAAEPAPEMDSLNRSLPIDRRMWREDVAGSRAWASALAQAGVLTGSEGQVIRQGLAGVGERLARWSEEDWSSAPDEDIHSLVERLLREAIGPLAGKLHTGRSRNDQVATDARLWAMGAVADLDARLSELQRALIAQAELHIDTPMPAYTHLQRAQPVSAAHWLLSHAWPLDRDRRRLTDAAARISELPLGSGAVAGCPFPVDRILLKETLGFQAVSANSIDAVADRDWVAELLFIMALIGVHLSKLGEDVILYASQEFAFIRLSDRFSTGSSLMPHKRNPDVMELARAKAGRLIGELSTILVVLKGLPSGYNKDLQEDKEALFAAFDTLATLLPAVTGTVRSLVIDAARTEGAVDEGMLTTDLAEMLVRQGVAFREAHEMVGRLVRVAEETGCGLSELPADLVARAAPQLAGADIGRALDIRASLGTRGGMGGTAPLATSRQIEELRTRL
jgi:argininosuccinate lyase